MAYSESFKAGDTVRYAKWLYGDNTITKRLHNGIVALEQMKETTIFIFMKTGYLGKYEMWSASGIIDCNTTRIVLIEKNILKHK